MPQPKRYLRHRPTTLSSPGTAPAHLLTSVFYGRLIAGDGGFVLPRFGRGTAVRRVAGRPSYTPRRAKGPSRPGRVGSLSGPSRLTGSSQDFEQGGDPCRTLSGG